MLNCLLSPDILYKNTTNHKKCRVKRQRYKPLECNGISYTMLVCQLCCKGHEVKKQLPKSETNQKKKSKQNETKNPLKQTNTHTQEKLVQTNFQNPNINSNFF